MGYNYEYPYVDPHRYNSDWLLTRVKELLVSFDTFKNYNEIKFADPINWDITRTYEKSTIVKDPVTNTSYISKQVVPANTLLSDPNYWVAIGTIGVPTEELDKIRAGVTVKIEHTDYCTQALTDGEFVWYDGNLYKTTHAINIGDRYVTTTGGNLTSATVSDIADVRVNIEKLARIEAITLEAEAREDADELEAETRKEKDKDIRELITSYVEAGSSTTRVYKPGDLFFSPTSEDTLYRVNKYMTTGSTWNADSRTSVTTVQEVLSNKVNNLFNNVKDFGATGDGSTDDTDAIKRCIAQSKTDKKPCVLPAGVYMISGRLTLHSGLELIGLSKTNTVIRATSSYSGHMLISENFDTLEGGGTATQPYNIHISNMTIEHNGDYTKSGNCISLHSSAPVVEDVIIRKSPKIGLYSNGQQGLTDFTKGGIEGTFRNILIELSGQHNFCLIGPNDSFIENLICVSASQMTANTYDNLYINSSGARIVHYHGWCYGDVFGYNRCRYSLALYNTYACEITESHIEGGKTGDIYMNSCVGVLVSNCYIYATFGNHVIFINNGNKCSFVNCQFGDRADWSTPPLDACVKFGNASNYYYVFDGIHEGNCPFVDETPLTSGGNHVYRITKNYTNTDFAISPHFNVNTYMINSNRAESSTERHMNFLTRPCVAGTPM